MHGQVIEQDEQCADGRRSPGRRAAGGRPGPDAPFGVRAALGMSTWFGLVVGPAELGLTLALKLLRDPSPAFFRLNRNILWTIPLVNLAVFGVVGLLLALLARLRPRRALRNSVGVLGGLALLTLLLTYRRLHAAACVLLVCGLAYRLAIRFEAGFPAFRRLARQTLPALALVVTGLVALSLGRHTLREPLARARLAPAPTNGTGAPNVLLIVLDTVRADRLSLYGYGRDTTPNLARLARRGVTFEQARSTAPWTLPSHASMMTGRWPHQNSARLHGPLDGAHPTLAQFLASHGYATAGLVANTTYCGAETGLDRGFAHYEDHDLSLQGILWTSALGRRLIWDGLAAAGAGLGLELRADLRKDAARMSRDVLAWAGRQGERPFFIFVNYLDAHSPYVLPEGFDRHFGIRPETRADASTLDQWFTLDKAKLGPRDLQLASDAYDDCLAYLDEQLGRLFDALDGRGLLDNTLVIVTADHGEHFGEHQLYCHASSLYDAEIHVPLLAILPRGAHAGRSVAEPVSLRDLAATVADQLGLGGVSPFPGRSLARHWDPAPSSRPGLGASLAEVDGPAKSAPNLGRSPVFRGPIKALVSGSDAYIRNGDGAEELYDLATDPAQSRNLAGSPAALPRLESFRQELERLTRDDTRPLDWRSTVSARRQSGKEIAPAKLAR
jgi:arylsulfatase A-like enzyme